MSLETFEVRRRDNGDKVFSAHKVFQFPGGESHIDFKPTATLQVAYMRSGNGDDLASLAMWADACKRHGCETIACIPYLPGARMDRGVPLGAKVYADIINAIGIDHVVAVDPHSDVASALYERLTVVPLNEVFPKHLIGGLAGVIAPDFGAIKRAGTIAEYLGVPVIQAGKHRDFVTGKLSGFWCDELPNSKGVYLMVDDICDGGGTFNGLADVIHRKNLNASLQLWVTHGIFSQGIDKLFEEFDTILTTDSHDGARKYNDTSYYKVTPILNKMLQATGKVYF